MALFVSLTNGLASPVARKRKTRNPLPRPLLIALSDRLTKAKINKREKKGKIKEFPIPLKKKNFLLAFTTPSKRSKQRKENKPKRNQRHFSFLLSLKEIKQNEKGHTTCKVVHPNSIDSSTESNQRKMMKSKQRYRHHHWV